MEFRCRLGTPGGEIIEGVYVADSEARLRREFEEKGLLVLGDPAGRAPRAGGRAACRRAAAHESPAASSSCSTRSWPRCSRRACRSCSRSTSCAGASPIRSSRSVLDDVYERVRAGSALSEAFEAHGELFPGVYTASLLAGEKCGNLEQVLRRYVSYVKVVSGVRRKTISALVYPAILLVLSLVVVTIIVLKVVPEFGAFYNQFGKELPLVDADHRRRLGRSSTSVLRAHRRRRRRRSSSASGGG